MLSIRPENVGLQPRHFCIYAEGREFELDMALKVVER